MKANAARLNDAIVRLLPFLLGVAIVTCGYLWFVQPRLGTYLRTGADVAALDGRVRTLQQTTDRSRSLRPLTISLNDRAMRPTSSQRVSGIR